MSTNPLSARGVFDLPLGQCTAITVPYLGVEYPGEVVLAHAWERALGETLPGDRFFRRMVEASNVPGLVQVLDDQIVSFLREVLKGP